MNLRKSFYTASFVAALVGLPATAMAAGFQNSSQSATAAAMGSSAVGNPDEPNASFYNPASMGLSEGLKVYIGDTILLPRSSYEPAGGGEKVSTEARLFPPPNAHLSYDNIADSGVSAGIGMTFSYGLGITWPDDWVGRTSIQSQDLQTVNINPNVAYRIPGLDLSVAAGAQIVHGSVTLKKSVAIGPDQFVDAHIGGTGFGFGGVAAVMYQPLKELTIGLQYRSRVKLDLEGDAHFEGEENTPFYTTFRDNPGSTEITLPDTIALGFGYQLDKLFLHAEVDYTMWRTYDKIVLTLDTDGDPDALAQLPPIEGNWDDAFAFRVGAQYDVTDAFAVRLGGNYDMTPIPDETVNPSLPGNDRISGSVGVGYSYESFRADAAYSIVHALPREIANGRGPSGTYSTDANIFALSLGYGF